ncbi:zinc finger protein 717 [Ixodes scapularis]
MSACWCQSLEKPFQHRQVKNSPHVVSHVFPTVKAETCCWDDRGSLDLQGSIGEASSLQVPAEVGCFNNGDSKSDFPSLRGTLDMLQPTTQSRQKDAHHCRFCPYYSRYTKFVTMHERTHTGEKPFPCKICHKAFAKKSYLKQHMRTHTGEKPFRCEVCPKAFALVNNLVVHRRVHTGEKPYQCSTCGKPFAERSTWLSHERIHNGERPFSCETCKKAFVKRSYLIRHWKSLHERGICDID